MYFASRKKQTPRPQKPIDSLLLLPTPKNLFSFYTLFPPKSHFHHLSKLQKRKLSVRKQASSQKSIQNWRREDWQSAREMRGRSSKQGGNNNTNNKGGVIEIEKIKKLKEEPHLSGAYIRSLVKQLTSSRTKDPLSPKPLDNISSDGDHDHHPHENPNNSSTNSSSDQNPQNQNPHHHQQPKKQVRRRLHTSRPYQERLLNMAEARREIVTALKFHRAAMKQANDQQQQQQNTTQHESIPTPFVQSPPPPPPLEQQEERMKCRRNPRIYPSNNNNTNTTNLDYINNLSSYSSFSCPLPPTHNPFFCPSTSSIAPLPIIDNLNLNLPNQPLGLNLNFHDFTNIDTNLYHNTPTTINNNNNQSSMNMYTYSSSSPSSSSSPPLVDQDPHHPMMTDINIEYSGGLHPMLDDDEMAEIRSIGEQHEMEWNDTLNLVTSAWWFKFMKKMEITSPLERKGDQLDDGFNVFDEVMEFPAWMNANNNNESCFLQQHLDDYYSQDYLQEPALPCMDIGEIDGMDGEWLA